MFALFTYSTQIHLIHDGTITNELAGAKKLLEAEFHPGSVWAPWDSRTGLRCWANLPKASAPVALICRQQGDWPDDLMWNSCVFLQPPFPLLPACPQLPAPVKSTVLGWTHLSTDPVQNLLCSFKDKSPSLGEGLVRDEMQSSERAEWKVTAIPSRSIWTRHREDCMAWGMEQPSENSEGFTGLM